MTDHICGDPSSPCDYACMERAHTEQRLQEIQTRLKRSGCETWKPASNYDDYGHEMHGTLIPQLGGCETFTEGEVAFLTALHDDIQWLLDAVRRNMQ